MNLTRFDRQKEFTPVEIACLICGIDPVESFPKDTIKNDLKLIQDGFLKGFQFCKGNKSFINDPSLIERCLFSVNLEKIFTPDQVKATPENSVFSNLVRKIDYIPDEFDTAVQGFSDGALDEYFDYFSGEKFDDAKFLVTGFSRSEVARWLNSNAFISVYSFFSADEPTPNAEDKPVGTRERNTLLTLIAVLCKEAKLDYSKHSKTAALIQSTAAGMGISIAESTIEVHLKKISDALATRMK